MKLDRNLKLILTTSGIAVFWLAYVGAILYVVLHFVRKFW